MLRKIDDRVAMTAVKVLIGGSAHYPAIKVLITRTKSKQKVISATIRLLLARLAANLGKNRLFHDTESLVFALELLPIVPLNRALADNVLKATARAGFHGRFPELPQRILKRHPDVEEVTLLVSAYVENKGSSAKDTEEKLERMALAYLPSEVAEVQIARIRAFQKEWAKGDIY